MKTIIVILAAVCIVGSLDVAEAERQQAEYCENVAAWKSTAGRDGAPAYKGQEVCK
jgi:hypothetical protein